MHRAFPGSGSINLKDSEKTMRSINGLLRFRAANLLCSICLPIVFSAISRNSSADELPDEFVLTQPFAERQRWTTEDDGVRVFVMAPDQFTSGPRRLVLYATPNGNTIEQTLGYRIPEEQREREWRHDIQHVAAQVRFLRSQCPDDNLILAVVQAKELSWPAWRSGKPKRDVRIRDLVRQLMKDVHADELVLSCHSGGGSFLWGWLNAHEELPSELKRVIFLDANYSYSDELRHGDKLLKWMHQAADHHLVVVAYDDREVTLNGRKVVSDDGGTYRASDRMISRLQKDVLMERSDVGEFQITTGLNGQVRFFVHRNPENRILHTALVGEMNGLISALGMNTAIVSEFSMPGGPRVYMDWVQPQPFEDSSRPRAEISSSRPLWTIPLPPRAADATSGSVLMEQLKLVDRDAREKLIEEQILAGNLPDFLRSFVPIRILTSSGGVSSKVSVELRVMSDYLAVGSDSDFCRMPMRPATAVRIAEQTGCILMTPRMSDLIHAAASVRLNPIPMTKDRESIETFVANNRLIEEQLRGAGMEKRVPGGTLISGVKKDLVLSNRLRERANRVALYGWHYPDGRVIQPLYVGHVDWYVDYSHGVRLVAGEVLIDGAPRNLRTLLADPDLCNILSGEGVLQVDDLLQETGLKKSTDRK